MNDGHDNCNGIEETQHVRLAPVPLQVAASTIAPDRAPAFEEYGPADEEEPDDRGISPTRT